MCGSSQRRQQPARAPQRRTCHHRQAAAVGQHKGVVRFLVPRAAQRRLAQPRPVGQVQHALQAGKEREVELGAGRAARRSTPRKARVGGGGACGERRRRGGLGAQAREVPPLQLPCTSCLDVTPGH